MAVNVQPSRVIVEPNKTTEATKRAWRTFLQQLAFDVAAALIILLLPIFSTATGFSDFDWMVILFSVSKTLVVTVLSFLMRYFKISPRTE